MIVNTTNLSPEGVQNGMVVPVLSVRMAMAVIALGPVILAFLFVQRYFVRGITLGSIKGD
jgi:putative aldouronate transport system permease protein